MMFRARLQVLATLVVATSLAWATGCEGDEDDCVKCCECQNDGDPRVFRPQPSGECATCEQQCNALSDRDFMGQEFDRIDQVACED